MRFALIGRDDRQGSRPLRLGLMLLAVLIGGGGTAQAELLVYEPFDYSASGAGGITGQPAGGVNLTGEYTMSAVPSGFELRVAEPGLSYGSLTNVPAAAGNRLTQNLGTTAATATVSVDQDVMSGPGTAIHFSVLFTFSDAANGNHRAMVTLVDGETGDWIGFGEPSVGGRAVRVEAFTTATGGSSIAAGADQSFTDGQTLLLIGRYINGVDAGSDSLELIGYDTADAVALPAVFTPSDPNAQFSFALTGVTIDLVRISDIDFTIRAAANNFIDELRIGDSYGDIIPEPASAMMLISLVAAGLRRRPRRLRVG